MNSKDFHFARTEGACTQGPCESPRTLAIGKLRLLLSLALTSTLGACASSHGLSFPDESAEASVPGETRPGVKPQGANDAGLPRPDTGWDAAADGSSEPDAVVEGGGDAASDADIDPPATLVFIRDEGPVSSLRAVDMDRPERERKLDPEVTVTPSQFEPLGYSPDGTRLLLWEYATSEVRVYVSYRCREQPCSSEAERLHLLLSVPGGQQVRPQRAQSPTDLAFAPDSRGAVLRIRPAQGVSAGTYYFPLGEAGPGEPLKVSDEQATVHLLADSRLALMTVRGTSMHVLDLSTQAEAPNTGRLLRDAAGNSLRVTGLSISPDGSHVALDGHAFSVSELLAGNDEGRPLGATSNRPVHSVNEWVVFQTADDRLVAQRWDGSQSLTLAEGVSTYWGCRDRQSVGHYVVLGHQASPAGSHYSAVHLDSPAANVPTAEVALPQIEGLGMGFTSGCSHWLVLSFDATGEAGGMLVNLQTGATHFPAPLRDVGWRSDGELGHNFSPNGEWYWRGGLWRSEVDRDGPADGFEDPVGRPHWSPDGSWAVARGSLRGRLLRLQPDAAPAERMRAVGPEFAMADQLSVTRDARYACYKATAEPRRLRPEQQIDGVWETNLDTGTSVRITPPGDQVSGGSQTFMPEPVSGKIVVRGSYGPEPRLTLALVDPRTGTWIPQLSEDSPVLPATTSHFWRTPRIEETEGGLLWYPAGDADGMAHWVQPVRTSLDEPVPRARRITDIGVPGPALQALIPSLGIFYRAGGNASSAQIHRFDLETGEHGISLQSGRVRRIVDDQLITFRQDPTDASLSYAFTLHPERPEEWMALGTGSVRRMELSNGGRWLVYEAGDSRDGQLRAYDLRHHTDVALPVRMPEGTLLDHVYAPPELSEGLLVTSDEQLWRVDLTGEGSVEVLTTQLANGHFGGVVFDERLQRVVFHDASGLTLVEGGTSRALDTAGLRLTRNRPVLSPNGRWLIARVETEGRWRLWDLQRPEAASRLLPYSESKRMSFDPTSQYLAGDGYWLDGPSLVVWRLARPDSPLLLAGEHEVRGAMWAPAAPRNVR